MKFSANLELDSNALESIIEQTFMESTKLHQVMEMSLEEKAEEAVQEALENIDFYELATEAIRDVDLEEKAEEAVQEALGHVGFEDRVDDALRDVGLEERVEAAVRKIDLERKVATAAASLLQEVYAKLWTLQRENEELRTERDELQAKLSTVPPSEDPAWGPETLGDSRRP